MTSKLTALMVLFIIPAAMAADNPQCDDATQPMFAVVTMKLWHTRSNTYLEI